jgi:hypothetical protein
MTTAEEASAQAHLLENVIATVQRLVAAEKDSSKITPSYLAEKVSLAAKMFEASPPVPLDEAKAVGTLIQRFSHRMGKSSTLVDFVGHYHWLTTARKQDWHYWRRYRAYQESKLAAVVVDGLDEATDDILALLEDPLRTEPWDRRGLVVGHVQSGKTGNYIGLINKAADAGYKIIIVLAGMHNNLRSQTQVRLEEGFLGYDTTAGHEAGALDAGGALGVAALGYDDLRTNSATTRSENGDFNAAIARRFHGISPEERPWLFVVKKQKTVLTELLKWIQTRVADTNDSQDGLRRVVSKLPLLMIDDEADNASVDTGEQEFNDDGTPDEEHQPKTINSLIRQLLHAFTRKAYVGYTATPFANIYIHHKGATADEGPDLFPKAFIINLAAPSNYIGSTRMFGTLTEDGRNGALPLSRSFLDHYSPEDGSGWMPSKHRKTHIPIHNGQETIPLSLRTAIHAFVLACAARELRGQGGEHSSMLIHVTRFVDVQNHVHRQVEATVHRMRQKVTRRIDSEELLDQLRKLWEEDFVVTRNAIFELTSEVERPPEMPSWDSVVETLPNVLGDIVVRSINGTAKDALDYATPGAALKVIAIGGDKLSRGLTLDGLCTSYFVRTTKMYDTLMQMGRWFGYRPGYLDLCRLYTSPDLIEWFSHISDASEELREDFDFMAKAKLTPEQYGLKVMSHEIMTVTSPMKMRHAQTLSLSYSGTRPQTILFHRDAKIQRANLEATDALIASLNEDFVKGPKYARNGEADSWPGARLWTDVNASTVLEFLGAYETHPNADRAKASVLTDFISKMLAIGKLKQWSVALLTGGDGVGEPHIFPGDFEITSFQVRKTEDPDPPGIRDPAVFAIGVLTGPKDEGIDLGDDIWRDALERTREAWKPDPARGRISLPTNPSGKGIREAREKNGGAADRGLLLLYTLSPYYSGKEKIPENLIVPFWDKPIMAFAIAFPSCDNGVKVEYEVSLLYWMHEYGQA